MESKDANCQENEIHTLVEILRKRVQEDGTFPLPPRTDAPFLAKFIRARKYKVDDAFLAIQKYYKNVFANLRVMEGVKVADVSKPFKVNAARILKHRSNGAAMIHGVIGKWNPKDISVRDLEVAATFAVEELLEDPLSQVHGLIGIIDLEGLGFCHARQITYQEVKRAIHIVFEMFPVRMAGVHILNVPTIFWPIYKFAICLLPKKLQERVFIHRNLESLTEIISPDVLPESLGGTLEEEDGWDTEKIQGILDRNPCYDNYWNGAVSAHRPRRLSRKRSSLNQSN